METQRQTLQKYLEYISNTFEKNYIFYTQQTFIFCFEGNRQFSNLAIASINYTVFKITTISASTYLVI